MALQILSYGPKAFGYQSASPDEMASFPICTSDRESVQVRRTDDHTYFLKGN